MSGSQRAGAVAELFRYPAKSMQGWRVDAVDVGERGIAGDREWAVALSRYGTLLSAKRDADLLRCRAFLDADGTLRVQLPSGEVVAPPDGAAQLSGLLGREVEWVRASPDASVRYDLPQNYATTGKGISMRFPCPPGTFFDLAHLHVLTTSTLRVLGDPDVRRLRPNVLVATDGDGFVEDAWVGSTLVLGEVEATVSMRTPRCVMTTREQGDLARDRDVLKAIATTNGNNAGIYANVTRPGTIRTGDAVSLRR